MGSFSSLVIAGYPLIQTKNYLDDWHFLPTDRRVFERRVSERNKLVWGDIAEEDDAVETAYEYQASVKTMKRRLDLMGFNMSTLQKEFEEACAYRKEELFEFDAHAQIDLEEHRQIYEEANLSQWIGCIRSIIKNKIVIGPFDNTKAKKCTTIEKILLGPQYFGVSYGIDYPEFELSLPCVTYDIFMRAVLEAVDDEDMCVIDATELVNGGWISDFDELIILGETNTIFFDVFKRSLDEIKQISKLSAENQTLSRMLFAGCITALETYLSDTAKRFILDRPALLRRYVEKDSEFQRTKIKQSDTFDFIDNIKYRVSEKLDRLLYHNLATIRQIYQDVFLVEIPEEQLRCLSSPIDIRHDIVHRNGRDTKGRTHDVSMENVEDLIVKVTNLAELIDSSIREVMIDFKQ